MIRTKTVTLSTIKAIAFRQKLTSGGSGITIMRDDCKQPGIASISNKTGEPIPTANTDLEKYPLEAFKEAMELTNGFPYKKQKGVKVNEKMFPEETVEVNEEEEVIIDSDEYNKIIDKYTDKTGKLSYDLMNNDFIKFAKSSTIVNKMVEERKSLASIRNYIISNRLKNITGNDDLTSKELKKIVEMLDEVSPKGVYKELNNELKKMLNVNKRK